MHHQLPFLVLFMHRRCDFLTLLVPHYVCVILALTFTSYYPRLPWVLIHHGEVFDYLYLKCFFIAASNWHDDLEIATRESQNLEDCCCC